SSVTGVQTCALPISAGILGRSRRPSRRNLEVCLMSDTVKVGFVPLSTAPRGILVAFCDESLRLGAATDKALGGAAELIQRAAAEIGRASCRERGDHQ